MSRNYIRLKQIEPSGLASLVTTGDTGVYNDTFLATGYSGYANETFYTNANPSGYATTGEVTGSITGYSYPLNSNPSSFTSTGDVTGAVTGYSYPLNTNPSGYVTSGETGALTGVFADINHTHQLASSTGNGFLSSGLYDQIRCLDNISNLQSTYKEFFPTLRLESPTLDGGISCAKTIDTESIILGGETGQEYTVDLRLRGIYETKSYEGGEEITSGVFGGVPITIKKGGTPASTSHNLIKFIVGEGDGEEVYYLNHTANPSSLVGEPVDLTFSIQITGGTKVRLSLDSVDELQYTNGSLTISGLKPYPEIFIGQFFELEAVKVSDICYLDSKFQTVLFENPDTCSGDYTNTIPENPGTGSLDIAHYYANEGGLEVEFFEEYTIGSVTGYSIIYGGANYPANSAYRLSLQYTPTGGYVGNADTAYSGEPIISGYTDASGSVSGLYIEYAGSGVSGVKAFLNESFPPIWDYGTYFETLGGKGNEGSIDIKRDLSRLDLIHDGGFDGDIYDILVDGKDIYVVGEFDRYANIPSPNVAKIDANGNYDYNFKVGCGFSRKITQIKKSTVGNNFYLTAGKVSSYKNSNPSEFIIKINESGVHQTGFDCENVLSDTYNRLISMSVISGDGNSENIAALAPDSLNIINGSNGSLIARYSGDYRFNSVLSHDKKLVLSSAPYKSYGLNLGQKYSDQLYPLSFRLLNTGDYSLIDSDWNDDDKAGTGGQSSCGAALFFSTGDFGKGYYIVGNTANLSGSNYFNSAGTSWNADVLGNYLLRSEQFDNAGVWTRSASAISITEDTHLAPNDNINDQNSADTLTDTSSGGGGNIGYIYQSIALPTSENESYIFSIYIRKDNDETRLPEFRLDLNDEFDTSLAGYSVKFNTKTGSYTLLSVDGNGLNRSVSVESSEDNLYWRISCSITNAVEASRFSIEISPAAYSLTSTNKQGGLGGSIVVFGAQFIKSIWQNKYDRILSKTTSTASIPAFPPLNNNADNFKGLYKISESGIGLSSGFDCDITLDSNSASHVIPFFIDSEQKIYIGGAITSIDGQAVDPWKLYRLNSDGTLDKVFDQFNGRVSVARLTSCGNIAVGGRFSAYGARKVGRFIIIDKDGKIVEKSNSGSDDVIVSSTEPDVSSYPCYKDKIWLDNSGDARLLKTWDESISGWTGPHYIGQLTKVLFNPSVNNPQQGGYYSFNGSDDTVSMYISGYPSSAIYYESGSGLTLNSITVPEPTTGSKLYSSPVAISNTGEQNIYYVFKAIGRLEFYNNAEVSSSNYLIYPQLPQVEFTADDGAPKQSSITLTVPGHSGATIYYRVTGIDNTEEACNAVKTGTIVTEGSYTASGISPLTVSLTSYSTSIGVQAIASKQNFRSSRKNSACYWVAGYGSNGQLPLVNYSPESDTTGVFPIEVTPTVLGHPLQSGVVIYYTTDGAEPTYTNSYKLKYPNTSLNFDVDADECNGLIKSFATRFLYTPSLVSTGVYVKETYTGAEFAPASGGISLSSGIFITGEDLGTDYTAYYSTSSGDADSLSGILYNKESGIRLENTSEISFYARVYKTGYCVSDLISGTYSGAKAPSVEFAPEQSEIRFGANNVSLIADGFTIYYETGTQLSNTNAPTPSSLSGASPVTLSVTADMAIRAYAVGEGYVDGEISETTYSKGIAPSVVFSPDGGDVKFGASGTEISISPITATGAGDAIYFDTGDGFKVYNGSFTINSGYEISGYIVADGLYNGPTGSALFSQKQLSGVSFSPSGDRNHDVFPFSVSISTTQDGIDSDEYDIYYVTGATGSADTTPSPDDNLYSTPFTITESGTVVAAIVSGDGYLPSETGIITYLLPKLENITFLLNN